MHARPAWSLICSQVGGSELVGSRHSSEPFWASLQYSGAIMPGHMRERDVGLFFICYSARSDQRRYRTKLNPRPQARIPEKIPNPLNCSFRFLVHSVSLYNPIQPLYTLYICICNPYMRPRTNSDSGIATRPCRSWRSRSSRLSAQTSRTVLAVTLVGLNSFLIRPKPVPVQCIPEHLILRKINSASNSSNNNSTGNTNSNSSSNMIFRRLCRCCEHWEQQK